MNWHLLKNCNTYLNLKNANRNFILCCELQFEIILLAVSMSTTKRKYDIKRR